MPCNASNAESVTKHGSGDAGNAFRRLKNFACVQVRRQDIVIWAKVDPYSIEEEEGFTRNVTHLGHAGTGNLEIKIQNGADLEKAKKLLERGYNEN